MKKIQRNISHKIIEEKIVDESPCMIIWAIPQTVDNSEYSAQYLYFDKKDETIEFNKYGNVQKIV